jgi:hypothetical protein
MKQIQRAILCLITAATALSIGCTEESKKTYIPGYWVPASFATLGIATEKAYNFSDLGSGVFKTCAPSSACMAIYAIWLNGTSYSTSIAVPGFALDDSDKLSPSQPELTFRLKMINSLGTWNIYIVLNGVLYTGTAIDGTDVTVSEQNSAQQVDPACTSSCELLKLVRIEFIKPTGINLSATTTTGTTTVTIQNHDYIIAQKYGL